jgi:hypothetical protein
MSAMKNIKAKPIFLPINNIKNAKTEKIYKEGKISPNGATNEENIEKSYLDNKDNAYKIRKMPKLIFVKNDVSL